jgi:hypothetical protein
MSWRSILWQSTALGAVIVLAACGTENDLTEPLAGTSDAVGLAESGPFIFASVGPAAAQRSYSVTIQNLTSGQPVTPPLLATHRKPTGIFSVGEPAGFELKEVAENGNLIPLSESLSADDHVSSTVVAVAGDPPPLMPGQSVTVTIEAGPGSKFLSVAAMLICTNDGFTGLDGQRLPKQIGEEIELVTDAYDAGTEINTEDFADLVPPCPALTGVPSDEMGSGASDPALSENGVIHHHDGIQGIADLVRAIHGWTNPVLQVNIRRTG